MCKYCEGDVDDRKYISKDLELAKGNIDLYIDGNNLLDISDESGFSISIKINNCPMCGRKLKESTEKNIEQKAHDNYNTWKEWWDKADIASKQAGITLEQGISFLDNLYKNHNK